MKRLLSMYLPSFPEAIVYMLQSTEYQVTSYFAWYRRTTSFRGIAKRRTLDRTKAAVLLLTALRVGIALQIVLSIACVVYGVRSGQVILVVIGGAGIVSYPLVWARLVTVPLILGRIFVVKPNERKLIDQSKAIFARHPGITIGIAGSYGKTTVKELLATVLGVSKKIAITPANKNVALSHALFAKKLSGDEEVLIIEYGEGEPGDVARFAETTKPDIGIITGIAPAHLDRYPSLAAAEADIFSLATYLNNQSIYVNGESPISDTWRSQSYSTYSREGIGDFTVSDVSVNFDGTRFMLRNTQTVVRVHSQLLGRHMIGPLALTVKIALELGMSSTEIESAMHNTKPYEHRMQPRNLGGGWIIDDTYNGNLEGIRAGLSLLSELPGTRKIYVTPGLVDQGVENERVHHEIGQLIAQANPAKVVLMQNSATSIIAESLQASSYSGEIVFETEPLEFYTNIEHFIAAGDVIMMQNDWTDNYF